LDWAALAALAACVAAAAAAVTAVSTLRLVREETAQARVRTGLDTLWHLTGTWESPGMAGARAAAAGALLSNRPSGDVDVVLDFFDEVALLIERQILDPELVWYELYWPMANYWFASQDYVRNIKGEEANAWGPLERVMPRLVQIEAQRRQRATDAAAPSKAQMRDFLSAEVGQGECEEDEVQRTPL
jgi:hypothetical protein